MNLKHFFSPQLIEKFKSKFNTDIQLIEFGGRTRLDMGGLTQSGRIIENIWDTTFKKLLPNDFVPNKVLILGFGAGSAARLISRKWPNASITGIEIDPMVIKIAKKYFEVDKIPNLNIINQDAAKYVATQEVSSFDLCLVDCYLGDQVPKQLQSIEFVKKLKKVSSHVLINRLFWSNYKETTIDFLDLLDHHFTTKTCRTATNLLISVS